MHTFCTMSMNCKKATTNIRQRGEERMETTYRVPRDGDRDGQRDKMVSGRNNWGKGGGVA